MSEERNAIQLEDGRVLTQDDITEGYKKLLEKREAEIAVLQPKADFYDAVTQTNDLIEMSKVAKILNYPGYGRNNLFKFLRDEGVLRNGEWHNNEPYQEYVSRGYFKIVEQKIDLADGECLMNRKTVVTQKGMDFIRRLLDERG